MEPRTPAETESEASAAIEPAVISPAPTSSKRQSRRRAWKQTRRKVGVWFALTLGPFVVRALSRTWRVTKIGVENLERARGQGGGHFMALWHGRMLIPAAFHTDYNYHVLVSPSGDGNVSGTLLARLGYGIVRGSSSKQAAHALREMLALLRGGAGVVITPDGPSGPMHSMNPGLAWLARASGYAIVPLGFVAQRAWHLKSWDRFTIPKPFARVAFVYGEPLHVGRDDDLNVATEELRRRILEAEENAFAALGSTRDW